jgi:NAD(P)-dependent dehydrogenase (short-subunit alcohol dehydrogenase family)
MSGRVFAITGAFGVLGQAVARAAAAQGARLALIDFARDTPAELTAALGDDMLLRGGVDLSDAAAADRAIGEAAGHFGGLDVLLNIAGGFRWETVEAGGSGTWQKMFLANLQTAVNASRAAIPHLKASAAGRIVNVGANAALRAGAGMGPYAASKAGIHRLTEALAEELKADGVTVNAVLPSIIDTPANRADMPDANFATWVAPDDLAEVILFLASTRASATTGALIPVTGRV